MLATIRRMLLWYFGILLKSSVVRNRSSEVGSGDRSSQTCLYVGREEHVSLYGGR
jgi:hypothetical protein